MTAVVALAILAPTAQAGFTIAVKPVTRKDVVVTPSVAPVAPASPSQAPAAATAAPVGASTFRMLVERGAPLKRVASAYAAQFGWSVAWEAGEIIAGDTMTFNGNDHEEALASFMRHYKLLGDRYPNEKGYLIYRQANQ